MSSQQRYVTSPGFINQHTMNMLDCYGMLANGRPNPYYQQLQHVYPGIGYISPYSTPNVIGQYQPFRELNRHVASGGYGVYNEEEMAKKFREFPLKALDRNNYLRSKM